MNEIRSDRTHYLLNFFSILIIDSLLYIQWIEQDIEIQPLIKLKYQLN